MKILKHHLLSIIVLVAFFGVYPREMQKEAPTIFALVSVFIYYFHMKIWDIHERKKAFRKTMQLVEEQKMLIEKEMLIEKQQREIEKRQSDIEKKQREILRNIKGNK
jgi:hypothetical protein